MFLFDFIDVLNYYDQNYLMKTYLLIFLNFKQLPASWWLFSFDIVHLLVSKCKSTLKQYSIDCKAISFNQMCNEPWQINHVAAEFIELNNNITNINKFWFMQNNSERFFFSLSTFSKQNNTYCKQISSILIYSLD